MNNARNGFAGLEMGRYIMEQKEDPPMCFSSKSNTCDRSTHLSLAIKIV
jgi:hypothetical protein